MHSTEIEIRREKQAQAVTRNYDSILHLIYAIVSIIFVAYLLYFVFDGLLNSDYSYTDLAKAAKVNQDSDSIFLSMFLVIPFAIWRTLKSVSGLVLYFTGRKAAKNGTKINKTGISFFGSFSSGESITLIRQRKHSTHLLSLSFLLLFLLSSWHLLLLPLCSLRRRQLPCSSSFRTRIPTRRSLPSPHTFHLR